MADAVYGSAHVPYLGVDDGRMVKIFEHPENQKSAMIDSSHGTQSVGSSPGVCNGVGEPGTAPPKRVPGCGKSSSAGALASTAAPVGSGATHACGDRQATRAQSSGEGGLRGQARHHPGLVPGLIARKFDGSQCRIHPGRPRISAEVEELVVRFARENSGWGYDRIVGALANLGHHISDQTVGNILRRHDVAPAPKRSQTTTWKEFISRHLDVLAGTDFFTVE